ncbi:hypothetical protein J6590_019756 [Homalodisca vitripennis]|nr:hypothetical protein J6590_019756 [Homalodisca vitripennis]
MTSFLRHYVSMGFHVSPRGYVADLASPSSYKWQTLESSTHLNSAKHRRLIKLGIQECVDKTERSDQEILDTILPVSKMLLDNSLWRGRDERSVSQQRTNERGTVVTVYLTTDCLTCGTEE